MSDSGLEGLRAKLRWVAGSIMHMHALINPSQTPPRPLYPDGLTQAVILSQCLPVLFRGGRERVRETTCSAARPRLAAGTVNRITRFEPSRAGMVYVCLVISCSSQWVTNQRCR